MATFIPVPTNVAGTLSPGSVLRRGAGGAINFYADDTYFSRGIRRRNGTFNELARGLSNDIQLSADRLQRLTAEKVRKSLIRPGQSHARLENAILAPENRVTYGRGATAGIFGIGIGVESFLDRSDARYWRQIEEGYGGHVGMKVFASSRGFSPLRTAVVPGSGRPGTPIRGSGPGFIARPIKAHHYFAHAWKEWSATEPRALREDFARKVDNAGR